MLNQRIKLFITVLFLNYNLAAQTIDVDTVILDYVSCLDMAILSREMKFPIPAKDVSYEMKRMILIVTFHSSEKVEFKEIPFGYKSPIFVERGEFIRLKEYCELPVMSNYCNDYIKPFKIIKIYNFYLSGPDRIHTQTERINLFQSFYQKETEVILEQIKNEFGCIIHLPEMLVTIGYPKL